MNKLSVLFISISLFASSAYANSPNYVISAQNDINKALLSDADNWICKSMKSSKSDKWTIGCFPDIPKSTPFFLFAVIEQNTVINPPYNYKITAVNGSASRNKSMPALKPFKIEREFSKDVDSGAMFAAYQAEYFKQ